ncbi:Protein mss51 [Grifola frondosa]|uniref:Protein mss51 n=1 Tax=Grifola frondosa TaxID=5627 RepID=A0A1C7MG95_GRIFR|nr:Protein mss51 [Grifola frondosa]
MLSPATQRSCIRLLSCGRPQRCISLNQQLYAPSRTFLSWFKKSKPSGPKEKVPLLTEDNLFHPFSQSPFPAVRARGEAIKKLAPCPAQPRAVKFECPDCGWPTHCSEEHWKEDEEHKKYCSRLREVNEDEHDLRSGRRLREFELPGTQDSEAAISFANWDVFWYTREFPSMDSERSRRHASKLLTYPITIGSSVISSSSDDFARPPGAPETPAATIDKPHVRVFILGARAESSLPAHVWEQLAMLFPAALVHLFFVGPQVSLPKPSTTPQNPTTESKTDSASTNESASMSEQSPQKPIQEQPAPQEKPVVEQKPVTEEKPAYLPNVYEPPTPAPIMRHKRTRSSIEQYGVPSYTVPYTPALTITGLQANYLDVHAQFQETFDPYTDCFFLFSPGFGFPSPKSVSEETGEPLLQIASPTEWGPVMPLLLASKCPIFVTGFSPADVERDVKSLSTAPEVAGEFDWVITPGPNAFGSEKWEVADFDPRVMVKTNWGIWGIRGKRREVRERTSWF